MYIDVDVGGEKLLSQLQSVMLKFIDKFQIYVSLN